MRLSKIGVLSFEGRSVKIKGVLVVNAPVIEGSLVF